VNETGRGRFGLEEKKRAAREDYRGHKRGLMTSWRSKELIKPVEDDE